MLVEGLKWRVYIRVAWGTVMRWGGRVDGKIDVVGGWKRSVVVERKSRILDSVRGWEGPVLVGGLWFARRARASRFACSISGIVVAESGIEEVVAS